MPRSFGVRCSPRRGEGGITCPAERAAPLPRPGGHEVACLPAGAFPPRGSQAADLESAVPNPGPGFPAQVPGASPETGKACAMGPPDGPDPAAARTVPAALDAAAGPGRV
ncbi:hypothetical protein GCM10010466_42320 [Planomonospora alba]|uniref:Uncharacterized protein n=1 Tax=Planomonospora alba TaxID=161354 RepID=A0ABP6NFM4_9ACTN